MISYSNLSSTIVLNAWPAVFRLGSFCQNLTSNANCTCSNPFSTGLSDWINAQGVLCQIYEPVVYSLWICNFLTWILVILSSLPKLHQIHLRFCSTRKRRLQTCQNPPSSLVTLFILFFLVMPCVFVVGMLRIFRNEESRIGKTLDLTISWLVARTCFYLAIFIHQPSLLRRILQAENIVGDWVYLNTFIERLVSISSIFIGFLVLPVYFTQNLEVGLLVARICFSSFLGIQLLLLLLHHLYARNIDKRINLLLLESHEQTQNDAVLTLKTKIHEIQKMAMFNSAWNVLLYLIWFVAPPLWIAHDYFLPISWFGMIFLTHGVVNSLYVKKEELRKISEFKQYRNSKTSLMINESRKNTRKYSKKLSLSSRDPSEDSVKPASIRFAQPPVDT